MSYHQYVEQDRRLAILRLLKESPDYSINDSVLQSALDHIGHRIGRHVVRADLAWLRDTGLVSVDVVLDSVHVATLTDMGLDVGDGRTVVDGVKRPSPRK